jgi:hypothetical protein
VGAVLHRTTYALCIALLASCVPAEAALVVSKAPSQNVTCDNGSKTCSATAADAVLNVEDMRRLLHAFDLTLLAASARDIDFRVPFSWPEPRLLTLNATGSVVVRRPLVVGGLGGLSITGTLLIRGNGRIDFQDLSSALSINGYPYSLANSVATLAQYAGGHVALAVNYDASKDGTYAAAPIANVQVLEGLGHTISNLSIQDLNTSHSVGLIASNFYGANIGDLGLVNVNIVGGAETSVGGLVGAVNGGFLVHDVYVSGTVQGGSTATVGGLVGLSDGGGLTNTILNSWSSATVLGDHDSHVGGLIGQTYDSFPTIVRNCNATGNVSVTADAQLNGAYVGGLVGESFSTEISNSFATGQVTAGRGAFAGGLVGASGLSISRSFATGSVTAGDHSSVGGLIGYSGGQTVAQVYASGSATAGTNSFAGGLIGQQVYGIAIHDTYSTGAVSVGNGGYAGSFAGQVTNKLGKSYGVGAVAGGSGTTIGGFVGADFSQGQISRSYWDTDTTGVAKLDQGAGSPLHDHGVKGLSSAILKSGLPNGFSASVWAQDSQINSGFPYLRALPPRLSVNASIPPTNKSSR